MRVEVVARLWGTSQGGPNGMAIATSFLAETLAKLGHDVQRRESPVFDADLTITVVSPTWRRALAAAEKLGAIGRLVYWHHASGIPPGGGAMLATPPAVPPVGPDEGWSRQIVLPPSSWAADTGGERTGGEIVVSGAGPPKGGMIALQAARFLPGTRWLVLRGRSSQQDRDAWCQIPDSEVTSSVVPPTSILDRAALVLSPTRFDVHPLLLVEASVRGIPVVCTDMPATRAAAGPHATYLPMNAPPREWAHAVFNALGRRPPKLEIPPYHQVVSRALEEFAEGRIAA